MKVKHMFYYHGNKTVNKTDFIELCEENGVTPTEDAISESMYAGYEIPIEVEWDLETGNCVVVKD